LAVGRIIPPITGNSAVPAGLLSRDGVGHAPNTLIEEVSMGRMLFVKLTLAVCPCLASAAFVTVTNQNSSLKFTIDDPAANVGSPSDPLQLARKLEWTVDGRRILVYPSGPSTFLDIGHSHSGAHVEANQIHAQGPLLGFATGPGPLPGTVTGGMVYSVDGGAPGSGKSRLSEKVDIHNKTSGNLSVSLAGLGFKPTQASLEVPDLTGLTVEGTTVVYFQGNAQTGTIADPPSFAPVTVLPVVTFSGFNPLFNQSFNLPAGAVLTMITELKVAPAPLVLTWILWLVIAAIVLASAMGIRAWSRRGQPN
jgi:hypothetical protein